MGSQAYRTGKSQVFNAKCMVKFNTSMHQAIMLLNMSPDLLCNNELTLSPILHTSLPCETWTCFTRLSQMFGKGIVVDAMQTCKQQTNILTETKLI